MTLGGGGSGGGSSSRRGRVTSSGSDSKEDAIAKHAAELERREESTRRKLAMLKAQLSALAVLSAIVRSGDGCVASASAHLEGGTWAVQCQHLLVARLPYKSLRL